MQGLALANSPRGRPPVTVLSLSESIDWDTLAQNSRQVIENHQREAQEGADMAAKDLAASWARRAACPAKTSSDFAPQVRSRQRCCISQPSLGPKTEDMIEAERAGRFGGALTKVYLVQTEEGHRCRHGYYRGWMLLRDCAYYYSR